MLRPRSAQFLPRHAACLSRDPLGRRWRLLSKNGGQQWRLMTHETYNREYRK
ncbi:ParE family toxin-like protein [Klebsiella pneumoniae]|uniref:ParE family toxin-like protein n=1 Tax=Klebsiella pneumoniae TaxID=573 RepID=UPI003F813615